MDVYQSITDKVIAAIEAGLSGGRCEMPWNSRLCGGDSMPTNAVGGYGYRGVNVLALWLAQAAAGYPTGEWATYRQWQSRGCQVRKGEKGTMTVFFKPVTWRGDDADSSDSEDGETGGRRGLIARAAFVFNAAQVDGYTSKAVPAPVTEFERHAAAEALIEATGATIRHGGSRAFYSPGRDAVQMPPRAAFRSADGYYAVAFHELGHWSGNEKRLARDLANRFGSEAYAAEELVAELCAAFLCGAVGISREPRPDHAQYIASWLKALRNDKRAIFTAASKAAAAADYIRAFNDASATKAAA